MNKCICILYQHSVITVTNMEKLWYQPQYCTNLYYTYGICGSQTLAPLADGPINEQKSCFSTFCTSPFSTDLSFSPLAVQRYHTDYSDWHWYETLYKRGTGCHELRPQDKEYNPHPPANYKDFAQDTTNTWLRNVTKFSVMSTKTKKPEKISSIQNAMQGHMLAHCSSNIT
jgi:hypothetical protein